MSRSKKHKTRNKKQSNDSATNLQVSPKQTRVSPAKDRLVINDFDLRTNSQNMISPYNAYKQIKKFKYRDRPKMKDENIDIESQVQMQLNEIYN